MSVTILRGDNRDVLRTLPDESVHCIVTSPPYWGLRDYGTGTAGIGLEETVDEHLTELVAMFREARRVLRSDGTMWVNYGDAYAGSWGAQGRGDKRSEMEIGGRIEGDGRKTLSEQQIIAHPKRTQTGSLSRTGGCKPKDLIGLPWMVAFALRADGWYLRQDIIWHKPNPMPESVTDRCTKAHEYIFLLSKSPRYFYDADAIKEESITDDPRRPYGSKGAWEMDGRPEEQRPNGKLRAPANVKRGGFNGKTNDMPGRESFRAFTETRNKRSVWTVATQSFKEAHFATFPPDLIEPCILAGCPVGGTVLDMFGGAGTTGLVADRLQRDAILIELNPDYAAIADRRIRGDAGMFAAMSHLRTEPASPPNQEA